MTFATMIFASLLPVHADPNPCDRASGPVERLIYCRDEGEIGRFDRKLNQLYAKLIDGAAGPERGKILRAQKNWLSERDACADRPVFKMKDPGAGAEAEAFDCVQDLYRARVATLDEAVGLKVPAETLPFAPKYTKASKDGKITFFNQELHDAYDQLFGSEPVEMDELKLTRIRARPGKDEKQTTRKVQSCAQFRAARERGFGYLSNEGFDDAWPYLICDLEKVLRGAKAATTKLDPKKLGGLVARSALFTFPDAPTAKEGVLTANGPERSLAVTVLALGDFNGDGREDALLLVTEGTGGGARWTSDDRVTIVGTTPSGASLTSLLPACGINRACAMGEEAMPSALEARLDRAPAPGAVEGYLLEAARPLVNVTLPKPANDPGPYRVYTSHDGGWFLDGSGPAGGTVKLKHPARKVVLGSISAAACLAPSEPFGGAGLLAGGVTAKLTVTPLTKRAFVNGCDYSFGGLGLAYDVDYAAGVRITAVTEGLPAVTAGLHVGDVLLSVRAPDANEAKTLKGLSHAEIARELRGAVGSQVTLEVVGADGTTRTVEATRALIDPTGRAKKAEVTP